ncbi:MAG: hypothetical protein KatS3mg124_2516 [Porticoccaceae bacterium]|nr:MAG: hypothetical protein KatS3mg124_2516 [Porticoccaceae bacterium]
MGALATTPPLALTASQRALVDAFEVALPPPLGREEALATIAALVPWFLDLQRRGSDAWRARRAELVRLSRAPQRTRRYLTKSTQTGCDFTDVGGIDIELCHVAGFDPRFRLRAEAFAPQARASNSNELPSGSRA